MKRLIFGLFALAASSLGFGEEGNGPFTCYLCGKPNATYERVISVLAEETRDNGDGNETTTRVTRHIRVHLCADCAFKNDRQEVFRTTLRTNPLFWIGLVSLLLDFALIILIITKVPLGIYRNVMAVIGAAGLAFLVSSLLKARRAESTWVEEHEYEYVSYAQDTPRPKN